MNIKQALAALDPTNDDEWTADGLPRVEAVAVLVGSEVTRRQITDANPTFMRPSLTPEQLAFKGGGHHDAQGSGFDTIGTPEPTAVEEPHVAGDESIPADDPPTEEPAEEPAEAPPVEDPKIAAYVEIHDQVVAMNEGVVASDPKKIERAIVEFGRQAEILSARREAIDKRLRDVGRRSARWQAVLNKRGNSSANQQRDAIRRYLEAQRVSRAKRAERAQKFIEAGTTVADVKAQLEGPSKIDAAMRQRKPARSAIRPVYPVAQTP